MLGHSSGFLNAFSCDVPSPLQIAEALRQAAERHRRPWYMLDPEGLPRRAWDLVAYALIWCLVVLVPLWIGFYMQAGNPHSLRSPHAVAGVPCMRMLNACIAMCPDLLIACCAALAALRSLPC